MNLNGKDAPIRLTAVHSDNLSVLAGHVAKLEISSATVSSPQNWTANSKVDKWIERHFGIRHMFHLRGKNGFPWVKIFTRNNAKQNNNQATKHHSMSIFCMRKVLLIVEQFAFDLTLQKFRSPTDIFTTKVF